MKNIVVKVVMWILFWWYLIPYYLFKKYVFRKANSTLYSALSTITVLFVLLFTLAINTPTDTTSKKEDSVTTHVVTKKVGSEKLKKSKAKQKILAAQKSEKQKEYNKLKDELEDKKQEQEDKQEKQRQQAAQKQEQEKAAQKQAAKQKEAEKRAQAQSHQAPKNNGDLNTASTGTIVGNSRSHIYHVPGQAGYRMNSANAVYFNSEQEAINAGYRKAKR
ncbi:DNA-entry nuclease [uncultured Lactobacillus sp.]|uniref:sunset domain-containing protein n=1 Tax=uncultured Lactobacillus sp. TaxID=153152 RepID=UPI00262AF48A|nr:DNA-entry nuclease [uncultured Lactobacillus sp.]